MAENYYTFGRTNFRNLPLQVKFVEQPPDDLRKSNFFKFQIELTLENQPVILEKAVFERFLHENPDDTKNGILYDLLIKHPSILGGEERRKLYITLVDASSCDPIHYEGHDDSPKMQRVLLTHEAICTRCSHHKSCGNKSEAPSDPRILPRISIGIQQVNVTDLILRMGVLQFFLKCNQNCLKGAGNPRDMRRFALAVSFEDCTYDKDKISALSDKIFVHNNSKHSRKRKKEVLIKSEVIEPQPESDPMCVFPKVGIIDQAFMLHTKQWSRHGVTFKCEGIELAVTSLMFGMAMSVYLPNNLRPGKFYITLYFNHSPVFSFPYEIQYKPYMDMVRSWSNGCLFLKKRGDPLPHQFGEGCEVAEMLEESDYPSYRLQGAVYPPAFNYAPQIQMYPYQGQNYSQGMSSSSSLSPNGSNVSESNSPPMYIPDSYAT